MQSQHLSNENHLINKHASQNHDNQNSNSETPKNVDIYTFDDLMISCAQEIMVNGIESDNIPSTIRDWISGKIVRALPKRLIQKLLAFLVDNRDMTETLGFREKANGDVPEFTLLLYRTARAKARHEKTASEKVMLGLGDFPNGEPESTRVKTTTVLFENGNDPTGVKFFSDEILVDQSQVIPVVQTPLHVKIKRRANAKDNERDKELARVDKQFGDEVYQDEVSEEENGNSELDYSSDEGQEVETGAKNTKKRKLEVDYMSERVQCHLCDKNYAQNSYLYNHYKVSHPEYWSTRPAMDDIKNTTFMSVMETTIKCQICDRPYSSSNQLRIHQMKKHPKFWEKRKIIDKRITPRMEIERGDFPELIYDADEKKYTCKVCGKQDWRPDKITLHVTTVHRKTIQATCHICNKSFLYKRQLKKHMSTHTGEYPYKCVPCNIGYHCRWKFVEEHSKKHHPEQYILYKSGELEVPCFDKEINSGARANFKEKSAEEKKWKGGRM